MVTTAGFANVEVGSILNRYPIRYWVKLLPFPAALKRGLINIVDVSRVGQLVVPLAAGNLVVIGCKRDFVFPGR